MRCVCRKKHAAEFEAQERKKAEQEARKAREEAVREQTRLLEREDELKRKKRRRSRERRRERETREAYDARWKELLAAGSSGLPEELKFADIPWPVLGHGSAVSAESLTEEAISSFLFHSEDALSDGDASKVRKEKLREAMLRFHPDKFEARIMARVVAQDQEAAREAVGVVVRTVSGLMAGIK